MNDITKSGIIILLLLGITGTYHMISSFQYGELTQDNLTVIERQHYPKYNFNPYSLDPFDGYLSTLELTMLIMGYAYGLSELIIFTELLYGINGKKELKELIKKKMEKKENDDKQDNSKKSKK